MPTTEITTDIDGYIMGYYKNNSYGTLTTTRAGTYSATGDDYITYLRWPLTSISSSYTATAVSFKCYVTSATYSYARLRGVTDTSYTESSTWNDVGGDNINYSSDYIGVNISSTGQKDISLNASGISYVDGQLGSYAYMGFGLDGTGLYHRFIFYSREWGTASQRPILSITYTIPSPTISSFSPTVDANPYAPAVKVTVTGTNFLGTMDYFYFVGQDSHNSGNYAATSYDVDSSTSCWGYTLEDMIPGNYKIQVQFDGGSILSSDTFEVRYHPE